MNRSILLLLSLHMITAFADEDLQTIPETTTLESSSESKQMILDRIEIIGNANISGNELAETLEIPLRRPVSASKLSDSLIEAERRLKASGKYEDNLSLKLVRGETYPHFKLEARLKEVGNFYFGIDGQASQGPLNLDESTGRNKSTVLASEIYWGNRDYEGSGLGFDLEWVTNSIRMHGNNDDDHSNSEYNINFLFNGITASVIKKGLISKYTYSGVISRTFINQNWSSFEYNSTSVYDSKVYTSDGSTASTERSFAMVIEPVFGVRIDKLLLGGKISRDLDRTIMARENHNYAESIDGVPQASNLDSISSDNDTKYSYSKGVEFSVAWSDKSRLTVIEPGLDIHATWSRAYYDRKADFPKWTAHAEETILLSDQLAWSFLTDGVWEYRQPTDYSTKLQRTIDIGSRLDFVTYQKMVVFGDFYRIGARRGELDSNDHFGRLALQNRFDAGIKYASPTFIYSLAIGYGAQLAGEQFIGGSIDSVYRRLGVR